MVVFSPIFVADTEIISRHDFVAPLSKWTLSNGYCSLLYKMLENHLWNSFSLYLLVEILQLAHEISSFSEVIYKRDDLKNLLKFIDKLKKQSSEGVLSKHALKNFCKIHRKTSFRESLFQWSCRLETWNCQKQPLEMFSKMR